MAEEFKRLARTLVAKGAIIDYYQDTIEVPGGHIVKWDLIDHHGAAAILPVLSDGRIVMVRQYRNALERMTLEIPAGGLEPGEDPFRCAVRELQEETGYIADEKEVKHLISIYTTVAFCNEKIEIYMVENLNKKIGQSLDEDERIEILAYEPEELTKLIYAGKIQDSKTVGAIMAYLHGKETGKL